jgi:hypothetical protein
MELQCRAAGGDEPQLLCRPRGEHLPAHCGWGGLLRNLCAGRGLPGCLLQGWTPLHWACRHNMHRLVPGLLQRGGDPNVRTLDDGSTSLHIAARDGVTAGSADAIRKLEVVDALLRWSGDSGAAVPMVNAVDLRGNTALHLAAAAGNRAIVIVSSHWLCYMCVRMCVFVRRVCLCVVCVCVRRVCLCVVCVCASCVCVVETRRWCSRCCRSCCKPARLCTPRTLMARRRVMPRTTTPTVTSAWG